jgi:pentapeptide repeat protein
MRTHTDRDVRILVARSSVGEHHVPVDLANAHLEMANLPHVDLRGANLAGANLRGAMLWGARLDGACLDGADLTCANLTWSSLRGCSLKGTLLVEADLDEAVMGGGSWDPVTAGADMVTITLSAEAWSELVQTHDPGASRESPKEAASKEEARQARDAAILRSHRESAPPSLRARGAAGFSQKHQELELARARVLSDGDLEELLRWSAATGKPLNLRGCNLSGASLRSAMLRGACLGFTNATGADTLSADLLGADLQDAHGW